MGLGVWWSGNKIRSWGLAFNGSLNRSGSRRGECRVKEIEGVYNRDPVGSLNDLPQPESTRLDAGLDRGR